jgi:hypothetical protein
METLSRHGQVLGMKQRQTGGGNHKIHGFGVSSAEFRVETIWPVVEPEVLPGVFKARVDLASGVFIKL